MSETTIYFITPTGSPTETDNSFMIQPRTIDGPVTGSIRQHTDLVLYGNGAENWGEKFNQNFYRLLENFACRNKYADNPAMPPTPVSKSDFSSATSYGMHNGINYEIPGQLWYNTSDESLHFFTGSEWKPTSGPIPETTAIPSEITTVDWTDVQNKPQLSLVLTGDVEGDEVIRLETQTQISVECIIPRLDRLQLDDLADVNSLAAQPGQYLVYAGEGFGWAPTYAAPAPASSSTISAPTTFSEITGNPLDNAELATSLNDKQSTITGGATSIAVDNLTASRILVSDENGKVATSDITLDTISYLANVSSDVQNQLDEKTTTSYVHNNGVGGSVQSFQTLVGCDVPTKRMVNVTYTNMTNNPIFVNILLCPTNTGKVTASLNVHESDVTKESAIDQVTGYCDNPFVPQTDCIEWTVNTTSSVSSVSLQGIVPPGYKYRCVTSDSVALLQTNLWRELR